MLAKIFVGCMVVLVISIIIDIVVTIYILMH